MHAPSRQERVAGGALAASVRPAPQRDHQDRHEGGLDDEDQEGGSVPRRKLLDDADRDGNGGAGGVVHVDDPAPALGQPVGVGEEGYHGYDSRNQDGRRNVQDLESLHVLVVHREAEEVESEPYCEEQLSEE